MTKSHLIIDGNAVLYKYYFGYKKEKIDEIIAIAHVSMLYKIQYLQTKYDTDNVVVVFDCENQSWRKLYTTSYNTAKVTHRTYKGGRREKLTPSEKKKIEEFDASIYKYAEFYKTQTTLPCFCGDYLEGDDLIAGYVQRFPDDNHVIYSADKDFLQLINSIEGTVTLVESQKDTERSLSDWNGDPELFMFEKCFRGEPRGGDNVQNAYPRLLKKKIHAAYTDSYLFSNLENYEFKVSDMDRDGNPMVHTYRTGDLLKENRLLMSLIDQPEPIKNLINAEITRGIDNRGTFEYMTFLRFCRRYDMDKAIKEKAKFINLLSLGYC